MDIISGLSEELLIKILSFLPTKTAASTSILSKRWEFLWMWLPKLEYNNWNDSESECMSLKCFLHRNLPLHRAPVLERFCLQFGDPHFKPEDIKLWVLSAVSRSLQELAISYFSYPNEPDILPSSLYACRSLVTLKLKGKILLDVPRMVCLPCLKTLQLRNVKYFNKDSLQRLLSNCPVLEDLSVDGCADGSMRKLIVIVPSLRRLTLFLACLFDEFVINTPSVEYLKLDYINPESHRCLIENMPKLEEASINAMFPYMKRLIGSITSVKRLKLCLEDDVYGAGFVFNHLENLKLCISDKYASNVLVRFLKDSPKLQVLDLFGIEADLYPNGVLYWNQPSSVPECLLSSLRTFKWSEYIGTPEERDIATYILQNARHLKTATIMSQSYLSESNSVPKLDMIKELALSPRASTACQLVFV